MVPEEQIRVDFSLRLLRKGIKYSTHLAHQIIFAALVKFAAREVQTDIREQDAQR